MSTKVFILAVTELIILRIGQYGTAQNVVIKWNFRSRSGRYAHNSKSLRFIGLAYIQLILLCFNDLLNRLMTLRRLVHKHIKLVPAKEDIETEKKEV